MDAKVNLIQDHRHEFGLNVCCAALGLSKSSFYWHTRDVCRQQLRDAPIRAEIEQIIADHPAYGWRRIQRELVERLGRAINHKRVRRLLGDMQLGLARCLPRRRPSEIDRVLDAHRGSLNLLARRDQPPDAFEALSTDFTELIYAEGAAKAMLATYLDINTKVVLGWSLAAQRSTPMALRAWQMARGQLQDWGIDLSDLIVHSDLDSVYRSYDYVRQLLVADGVSLSYSERGARDNPWIESLWGRLKVELGSAITCAQSQGELVEVIEAHLGLRGYYNDRRRHSALDYRAPLVALAEDHPEIDLEPP